MKPLKTELHLPRRLFHMTSGLIIALVSVHIEAKRDFVLILGLMTLTDLLIEGMRLIWPAFNQKVSGLFGILMREGEQNRLSGIAYYLIGCTFSALVFPRVIAVLAILYLAFGDSMAALFGSRFGRRPLPATLHVPQKSIEGSLACFIVCTMITYFMTVYFSKTEGLVFMDRWFFAILGGASAVLGELLPLRTDDNLALPLVSGCLLWLAAAVFNLIPGLYF